VRRSKDLPTFSIRIKLVEQLTKLKTMVKKPDGRKA
jgi:hypothetical protein